MILSQFEYIHDVVGANKEAIIAFLDYFERSWVVGAWAAQEKGTVSD